MQDETGGRRSWPVTCADKPIDPEWLWTNRDQILAEAVAAYDAGETWHLVGDELIALQKASTAERHSIRNNGQVDLVARKHHTIVGFRYAASQFLMSEQRELAKPPDPLRDRQLGHGTVGYQLQDWPYPEHDADEGDKQATDDFAVAFDGAEPHALQTGS